MTKILFPSNMPHKYKTVTVKGAESCGFVRVTEPYNIDERDMLDTVIRDMQGTTFLLVDFGLPGIAVFRRKTEVKFSRGPVRY